jgi:hypothetical protein
VPRPVGPGTTAKDMPIGIAVKPRRSVYRSAMIAFVPRVLAPLRDIAEHVVQTPEICLKVINGDC